MYNVTIFGLGHNHGGTGFFIEYHYNPNISSKNYFNALEREKAITYGKQIALNRGDTDSIEGMGEHDIIEVLMPEMVKVESRLDWLFKLTKEWWDMNKEEARDILKEFLEDWRIREWLLAI